VLSDAKVSRRHALIQAQKQYEFWLLDLGSSNGTYLNGHRVTQPMLLRDRDHIEVGPFRLIFRQSKSSQPDPQQSTADQTIFAEKLDLS
jgi:adenylate cyclase